MPRRNHRAVALTAARSRARRRAALGIVPVCSECGGPLDTSGAYCRDCRAGYMREYRARPEKKRRRRKVLPGAVESVSRKLSRGTSRLEEVTMANPEGTATEPAEELMPGASLEAAAAAPAAPKPTLVVTAAQKPAAADPIAAAGRLMVDRVRRLMAVAQDLDTAAAQLETLTGTIIPAAAAAPADPDPDKDAARYFFEALDHLLMQIERRSMRVSREAAKLDSVFDLSTRRSA